MKQLMSTKKWLADKNTQRLILYFITWKCLVFLFAYVGVVLLPLHSPHFFGGGLENYLEHPLFWGWANFDGEHYLAIAQRSYKDLEHSFFPLYPLLISFLSKTLNLSLFFTGFLISNLSFLASLFLLWRLVLLDYNERIAFLVVILMLLFPTSFFFGSFYTESSFLLLIVVAFFTARQGIWLVSGIAGGLASAARLVGILLLPALLMEWYQQRKENKTLAGQFVLIFFVLMGLLGYIFYLYKSTGNPLAFYTDLSPFGEHRSGQIILLYQVFWRYIKMLFTVVASDPIYFTISIEFVIALGVLALFSWGWFRGKVRRSYLIFAGLGYVLPTLTGSFSSLPRYVLVLFPLFILLALFINTRHKIFQLIYFSLSLLLLAIETVFFIRGYWVA